MIQNVLRKYSSRGESGTLSPTQMEKYILKQSQAIWVISRKLLERLEIDFLICI